MRLLLCGAFCAFCMSAGAYARAGVDSLAQGEQRRVIDRFAFKTNVFEWLVTIPNVGVEYELGSSEFNKFSVGLTAKYNWNTYHSLVSPTVFNMMDVRPEFRYYYRSRKPERGVKHHWYDVNKHLRDRKNPRPWRAHYVGLYGSYGHYGFKFSEKGYQGECAGFGASAGYALPLYEYRRGYIDVELGFSVGVQWATKDVFVHDRDANAYERISESKSFEFTPFPVVSELRVAFAWRSKSIKDKIKDDVEKARVKAYFKRIQGDYIVPLKDLTKAYYDENITNTKSEREARRIRANDSLYVAGFMELLDRTTQEQTMNVSTAFPDEMKGSERQDIRDLVKDMEDELVGQVKDERRSSLKAFKKEWAVFRAERRKAERAAAKVAREEARIARKAEREAARLAKPTKEEAKAMKQEAKAARKAAREEAKLAKEEARLAKKEAAKSKRSKSRPARNKKK